MSSQSSECGRESRAFVAEQPDDRFSKVNCINTFRIFGDRRHGFGTRIFHQFSKVDLLVYGQAEMRALPCAQHAWCPCTCASAAQHYGTNPRSGRCAQDRADVARILHSIE